MMTVRRDTMAGFRKDDNRMAETPDVPADKKPELVAMIPGNQITVEMIEKLCIRLTGKSFTPEERIEAEEIAALYAKPSEKE